VKVEEEKNIGREAFGGDSLRGGGGGGKGYRRNRRRFRV